MVVWDFWTINSMMSSKFAALFSTSILTFLHLFIWKQPALPACSSAIPLLKNPREINICLNEFMAAAQKPIARGSICKRNNLMLGRSRVIKNMCGWIFGWLEVSTIMMNTNMENKQKSTFNKFVVFFSRVAKKWWITKPRFQWDLQTNFKYPSSDLTFSGCFPQTFLIDSKSSLLQQGENLIT